MVLDKNRHSVYKLQYHMVLVTKYRKKVIDNEKLEFLKNHFIDIGKSHFIELIEINHDKDHIHVLFKSKPEINPSKFINAYKSASSRLIKKEFPEIKKELYKEAFWSRSFFLVSVGDINQEIISQYIKTQGE